MQDADQLSEVLPGEILVATITAPSWGPIFGRIKATVTDIGGMMSHAAIVCREYGLPAVTGTGTASTTIKTGQWLRVNGTKGTVEILEHPRSRAPAPTATPMTSRLMSESPWSRHRPCRRHQPPGPPSSRGGRRPGPGLRARLWRPRLPGGGRRCESGRGAGDGRARAGRRLRRRGRGR
ncbi:PEP-utilizing enzyme [Arthrobacter alpinus]|nr:PEP-utilizing enzyme [Arthrobacter alpinus]